MSLHQPEHSGHRFHLARLALLAVVGCLAGCGGTSTSTRDNGIIEDTAQEALAATTEAAAKADSVTIKAKSSLLHGRTLKIDLALTKQGGHGTINLLGSEYEMLRTGQDTFIKGPPAVYKRFGITKTIPAGTWVKLPATGQAGAVLDLASETARILSTSGNVSKGTTTTIAGEPALQLNTEGKLYKGTLYVKTTGQPYPIKLEKHGRETGTYTFTSWNNTPAPTAPTKVTQSK